MTVAVTGDAGRHPAALNRCLREGVPALVQHRSLGVFCLGLVLFVAGMGFPRAGEEAQPSSGVTTALAAVFDDRVGSPVMAWPPGERQFYAARAYAPAWHTTDCGHLLPRADELLRAIEDSREHGLDPAKFGPPALRALRAAPGVDNCARLDAALTGAFLRLATSLYLGETRPQEADPAWHIPRAAFDAVDYLSRTLESVDVHAALYALAPQHPGYRQLLRALAEYREIAARGGWPALDDGPKLQLGDTGPRVAALRNRLQLEGYQVAGRDGAPPAYDAELERAVREFQARHTITVDGVTGRQTLATLNVPVEDRLEQIMLNLERWRWLPRSPGQRYLMVNVPGYLLAAYEGDNPVLSMRIVIGRTDRPTPSFADTLTQIIINPFWNVPWSIALKDVIPEQVRNAGYLASRHIRVLDGSGENTTELDPASLDWASFRRRGFPYRLRQDPGPDNAMGRIKFPLHNPYSIFLHDTPDRALFGRAARDKSSGCIRVADAEGLAVFLFAGQPGWDATQLQSLIASGATLREPLPRPIPVFVVYLTAWADVKTAYFANDIYHRDERLGALLSGD